MMGTEATATTVSGGRAAPAALCLQARAWSRTSKVLDLDAASPKPAPSLGSSVGVPFFWEEAPGRPKVVVAPEDFAPPPPAPAAAERTLVSHGAEAAGDGDKARHVAPLKLPPRLQAAAAAAAAAAAVGAADSSLSPKTVLHGPYSGGGNKPPRPLTRSGSTASHLRKPSTGVSLWKKATAAARGKKHDHDAAALDSSCRSPASSSSSSSSTSISYFADDHRRQADGHDDPEPEDGEECGDKSTVRIMRFRRNRSIPSVTTSHLWASIRRSVRQITPWN